MELKQLPSQKQPAFEAPVDDKIGESVRGTAAESKLEGGKPIDQDISSAITDEVLRHRIRLLIDEKPPTGSGLPRDAI